jgi:FkbM family methyltransferase
VTMLLRAIIANGVGDAMFVVAAAVGKEAAIAELRLASTMGNAVRADKNRYGLQVPLITVDSLLNSLGGDRARRIVMKIDVEGIEPDVLRGAEQTIQSGRVALIIWERGQEYRSDEDIRSRAIEASRWLSGLGYRHYTLPYHEWGGPLIPATDDWFFSNIFSFAPGVQRREVYPQTFAERPPYEAIHRMTRTPERTAEVARMCIEARTSDGIRWADPAELEKGAEARAVATARFIAPGSRVLDVGCGSMALSRHLPPGCSYQPADLIARSDTCAVMDLNQSQFPQGAYDVVALLEVLEYVHDVDGLLRRCRAAAQRLLISYQPRTSDQLALRREKGFLSDLRAEDLASALEKNGFSIAAKAELGAAIIWSCQAR